LRERRFLAATPEGGVNDLGSGRDDLATVSSGDLSTGGGRNRYDRARGNATVTENAFSLGAAT
jgi:hypothetical protein